MSGYSGLNKVLDFQIINEAVENFKRTED